jgi:hypothetical protein
MADAGKSDQSWDEWQEHLRLKHEDGSCDCARGKPIEPLMLFGMRSPTSGLSESDERALRGVVGEGEQDWTVFGWRWERVGWELHSAAESVDVLRDALSPDDFIHLKSEAAKRLRKVDEALEAVIVELKKAAPHLIEGVRERQRDIQASLERAVFEGEPPPDVMTVTGEYER